MADLRLDPYADVDWDDVQRHEAQLHAHTWHPPEGHHSGTDPPEVVVDDYREAGYSVLALSDHEYNVEEATWPWADFDRDPDDLGMVAVLAVELAIALDPGDPDSERDLLSYFCDLADTDGMSVHDVLDEIGERGGIAVFPHPSRYDEDGAWYEAYFRAHPHLLGVEVVNAADRYPTDRDVWDDLLGRLAPDRPVWGFSNDDYHGRGLEYSFDRSRNVLLLEELTEEAVREALVDGRFLYQHVVEGDGENDSDGGDKSNDGTEQSRVGAEPSRVDRDPPRVDAIRHDPDRGTLTVDATGYDVLQWASGGELIESGSTLRYREVDGLGSFARARLVAEDGSETGTQPFLFG